MTAATQTATRGKSAPWAADEPAPLGGSTPGPTTVGVAGGSQREALCLDTAMLGHNKGARGA